MERPGRWTRHTVSLHEILNRIGLQSIMVSRLNKPTVDSVNERVVRKSSVFEPQVASSWLFARFDSSAANEVCFDGSAEYELYDTWSFRHRFGHISNYYFIDFILGQGSLLFIGTVRARFSPVDICQNNRQEGGRQN